MRTHQDWPRSFPDEFRGLQPCSYTTTSPSSQGLSKLGSRRANNSSGNLVSSRGPQLRPTLKALSSASDPNLVAMTQGSRFQGHANYPGTSRPHVDQRSYSSDSMEVRKWVAASATGSQSPNGASYSVLSGISRSHDISTSALSLPGGGSDALLSVSEFPLPSQTRAFEFQDPRTSPSVPCTASPGDALTMAMCGQLSMESDFLEQGFSHDEHYAYDWAETQSYVMPGSVEMMYTTSADFRQDLSSNYNDSLQYHPKWSEANLQRIDLSHEGAISCSTSQAILSPLSAVAMDPSISSYSHNSYLPFHLGSPGSSSSQEDPPPLEPNGVTEDDTMSPLTMDIKISAPYDSYEGPADMTSTSRAPQSFQQTTWSNSNPWPSSDAVIHPPMAVPYQDTYVQRRMSGDGDVPTARHSELYHVSPGADGLYHCPFGAKEGCQHQPDKLKCNYDKHLDSHLKPYRCKVQSCSAVPFSSTACLLRHEREAHGMHGHGEKPYLCTYRDCDRATPGNGFPRRWNLQDHMKRVHDYTAPPSSTGSTSPSPSSVSSQTNEKAAMAVRKRRTSNNSQTNPPKRSKAATTTKTVSKAPKNSGSSSTEGKQRQSMRKQWHEKHAAMKERLEKLQPTDAYGHEQFGADFTLLQSIGTNIRRLEAGQLASAE